MADFSLTCIKIRAILFKTHETGEEEEVLSVLDVSENCRRWKGSTDSRKEWASEGKRIMQAGGNLRYQNQHMLVCVKRISINDIKPGGTARVNDCSCPCNIFLLQSQEFFSSFLAEFS